MTGCARGIRTTTNCAGQSYFHLVESYREGGKVKQRTLLALGRKEDGGLEALAEPARARSARGGSIIPARPGAQHSRSGSAEVDR